MSRVFKYYLIGLFTLVVCGVTGVIFYVNHLEAIYTVYVKNNTAVRLDDVVIRSDAGVLQFGSLLPGEQRGLRVEAELNTTHWTYRFADDTTIHTGGEWYNRSDVGGKDAVIEINATSATMYGVE